MPQTTPPLRVVVLISGSGSNLQALIDGQQSGELPIDIVAVISNKDDVKGLIRAEKNHIPAFVLDHKQFPDRTLFDARLMEIIDAQNPNLIVLAGFMRILTSTFTGHYHGRMMNIHPSLLPRYPGLNTHQRAINAGDKNHGATVHFVTDELDGGPPIIQARVPILPEDTPETLAARVLVEEHKIYPLAVQWFAERRLKMEKDQVYLDGQVLGREGKCVVSAKDKGAC